MSLDCSSWLSTPEYAGDADVSPVKTLSVVSVGLLPKPISQAVVCGPGGRLRSGV